MSQSETELKASILNFSSVSSLRGRPPKGEKGDRHRHHRKKSKRDSIIRVQVDLTEDIFEKHKVTFHRNHCFNFWMQKPGTKNHTIHIQEKRNELFICSKQMYDAIQRYYKLQQLEIITCKSFSSQGALAYSRGVRRG